MKAFLWSLLAAIALLGLVPAAQAGSYVLGADGHYWKDGVAYKDHGYWYQEGYTAYTYSACGCYKYPYTAWRWKWYYDYRPIKLDARKVDRADVIALAARRDKEVLAIAADQAYVGGTVALIRELGLSQNFRIPNYANGVFPAQRYAGAEVYGKPLDQRVVEFSQVQSVDAFNTIDLNLPFQQQGQALKQLGELLGISDANFSSRLAQGIAGAREIAVVKENGRIAVELLKASQPSSLKVETRVFGTVKGGNGPAPEAVGPPAIAARPSFASVAKSCVQCHAGPQLQGGFDITSYHPSTAGLDLRSKVERYVTSPQGCPKGGKPLTEAEVWALVVPARGAQEALPEPRPE